MLGCGIHWTGVVQDSAWSHMILEACYLGWFFCVYGHTKHRINEHNILKTEHEQSRAWCWTCRNCPRWSVKPCSTAKSWQRIPSPTNECMTLLRTQALGSDCFCLSLSLNQSEGSDSSLFFSYKQPGLMGLGPNFAKMEGTVSTSYHCPASTKRL